MRACWLKWVGRDWSISADYIWLNYSDANTSNCRWQGHSNPDVGVNDVILDGLLGDLECSGLLPGPFADLVRDDSLDVCLSYVLGCLDGLWCEFAMEHFESKRATSFDVALLVCYDMRYVKACAGLIVTNIRAGEVIDNRHVVGSILVYYAYACFCYGSAIHHNSMLLVILPFGYSVVAGHSVCGVL